jgi:hypothetical protein
MQSGFRSINGLSSATREWRLRRASIWQIWWRPEPEGPDAARSIEYRLSRCALWENRTPLGSYEIDSWKGWVRKCSASDDLGFPNDYYMHEPEYQVTPIDDQGIPIVQPETLRDRMSYDWHRVEIEEPGE